MGTRKFVGMLMVATTLVSTMPSQVSAQQPATDVAREVETLSRQGSQAYRDRDYAQAIRMFEQAYALESVPNLLYNIAKCYEKMERWDDAIRFYEKFLISPDVETDARQSALERIQTLRGISQSGRVAEPAPAERPMPTPSVGDSSGAHGGTSRAGAYAALGFGAGFLAAGGVFGWLASQSEQEFTTTSVERPTQREQLASQGKSRALVADGLYVAGALGTVIGAVLLLRASDDGEPSVQGAGTEARAPRVDLAGPGDVGVRLSLSF